MPMGRGIGCIGGRKYFIWFGEAGIQQPLIWPLNSIYEYTYYVYTAADCRGCCLNYTDGTV